MTTTTIEKKGKWRNSITFKLILIVLLSLVLLIPSLMVMKLIDERNSRRKEAINEVTDKWSNEQQVAGPIIVVPYEKNINYSNGTNELKRYYYHILPEKVSINGDIQVENRKRGIYKIPIYTSDLEIQGVFTPSNFEEISKIKQNLIWEEARLVVGISDLKGVSKKPEVIWNGKKKKMSSGNANSTISLKGINMPVTIDVATESKFSLTLSLKGSDAIFFIPTANDMEVNISSNWNVPSFDGCFIPTRPKSETNNTKTKSLKNGFSRKWNINEMSRIFPQTFSSKDFNNYDNYQPFGVRFLQPVDAYQKSTRAVKYSFLFIILTFLIIFFSEILSNSRIHAIQYLIVGIALIIFYSLLISLAEHIPFNLAYLISGVTIVSMNTFYIHSLLKNKKATITVLIALSTLYIFLFTILQISDYALLLGNIGLVLILGAIMFFSKKVDWYGNQKSNNIENTNNDVN